MPVYTVAELLEIRHQMPVAIRHIHDGPLARHNSELYFSLWEKYNRLLRDGPNPLERFQVERRYSYVLSNRQFKREVVSRDGNLSRLKSHQRLTLLVDRKKSMDERHAKELDVLSGRLDALRYSLYRGRALPNPNSTMWSSRFIPASTPQEKKWGNLNNQDSAFKRRLVKLVNRSSSDGRPGVLVDFAGGPAISDVMLASAPLPEHKKYWYFKRKRGMWHVSQHHPYGDELQAYESKLLDSFKPFG
jgi:hypothetical protein